MYETFPKKAGKSFDTVTHPAGWNDSNNGNRDRMKSGRNSVAVKAGSNYKVKAGKAAAGNTSRREYPKKGNSAQAGFGTGA